MKNRYPPNQIESNQYQIFSLLKERLCKHYAIDNSNTPKGLDSQLWAEAEEIGCWFTASQLTDDFISQWLDLFKQKSANLIPHNQESEKRKSKPHVEHDNEVHVTNYGSLKRSSTRFINFT